MLKTHQTEQFCIIVQTTQCVSKGRPLGYKKLCRICTMMPVSCTRKVVICGREQVGKTAIFKRLAQDFSPTPYLPTVGAQFQEVIAGSSTNISVTLQLWDTAGQERFEAVIPAYFRGSDFVLMVCDLTLPESLESLRTYWKHQIDVHAPPQAKLFLIGNKSDLLDKRQVPECQLQDLRQELGCVCVFETSALTHEGIHDLLQMIADMAVETVAPTRTTIQPMPTLEPSHERGKCC